MNDFNWDDHPIVPAQAKPTKGFSWDDHPIVGDGASPLVIGVRNLAQGASAGFSDELAGAAEAGGRMVGLKGVGGPMKDISAAPDGSIVDIMHPIDTAGRIADAYTEGRNKERATLKQDAKDDPKLAGLANLAGAIVSPRE
jgi:hypothetical protein